MVLGGVEAARCLAHRHRAREIGFRRADLTPPDYEHQGIEALLEGLMGFGWAPIRDRGKVIGLTRHGAAISLEPGGQLELSGAPMADPHQIRVELTEHFPEVHAIAAPLGLGFAPLGFHPMATREQMPWMPKSRYAIMRNWRRVGRMGLDMMLCTCTVQVNLDFGAEADMVEKLRVSLALQPVATALFANSPFAEGRPNGLRSCAAGCGRKPTRTAPASPPWYSNKASGSSASRTGCSTCPCISSCATTSSSTAAGASFRAFMKDGLWARVGDHGRFRRPCDDRFHRGAGFIWSRWEWTP